MQRYLYVVLLFLISTDLLAQQYHYWTNQFGSRSALMGGAVVGGVRDTSATFYNPGALGFVKKSSFSVSANAYQVELASIDNGAGTDEPREIESRKLNIIPLLISGTTTFGNNTFGYSLIGKNQSSIKLSGRQTEITDIIDSNSSYIDYNSLGYNGIAFQGVEDYRSQFTYSSEVTEMLGGLSWSTNIYPHISLGVSSFFGYRTQSYNNSKVARAVNNNSQFVASEDKFSDADFYNVRTFFKFGIAADFDKLKLGATLTTPSVSLFGSGSVGAGNVRFKGDDIDYGIIGDDRQNDLDATYKTPMSLALGMEYQLTKQTLVATTIEWFTEQSNYEIMTPRSKQFLVGSNGLSLDSKEILTMQDGAASIVNFAFAVEHVFSKIITGYV
ncbi:MAG: hypothetical protein KAG43_06975, partial [Candidatus Marithrix sp.]|nr:hypothetical protein [Candidatus Marithrix sp.]